MSLISLSEWAKRNGIKRRTAYNMANKGLIPAVKKKGIVLQERKMWMMMIEETVKAK